MPKYDRPVKNVKYTPQPLDPQLSRAFERQEMAVAAELYGGGAGGISG